MNIPEEPRKLHLISRLEEILLKPESTSAPHSIREAEEEDANHVWNPWQTAYAAELQEMIKLGILQPVKNTEQTGKTPMPCRVVFDEETTHISTVRKVWIIVDGGFSAETYNQRVSVLQEDIGIDRNAENAENADISDKKYDSEFGNNLTMESRDAGVRLITNLATRNSHFIRTFHAVAPKCFPFPNSDGECDKFVVLPKLGCVNGGVYRLCKSIYGTKEWRKQWLSHINSILRHNFQFRPTKYGIFITNATNCTLLAFADSDKFLISSENYTEIIRIFENFPGSFRLSIPDMFSGFEFIFSASGEIKLHQFRLISDICRSYSKGSLSPVYCPSDRNFTIVEQNSDNFGPLLLNEAAYKACLAELAVVARKTRPDIFGMIRTLINSSSPKYGNGAKPLTLSHELVLKRIVNYLSYTRRFCLVYRKPEKMPGACSDMFSELQPSSPKLRIFNNTIRQPTTGKTEKAELFTVDGTVVDWNVAQFEASEESVAQSRTVKEEITANLSDLYGEMISVDENSGLDSSDVTNDSIVAQIIVSSAPPAELSETRKSIGMEEVNF